VIEVGSEANKCWGFLDRAEGKKAFAHLRNLFGDVYNRKGKNAQAHAEVCGMMQSAPVGTYHTKWGRAHPRALGRRGAPSGRPGQLLELPILEVRFAHNDQSEHFAHGGPGGLGTKGSLLQLAVELLTGLTPLSSVPLFTVCRHAGQWFCRSGNRRLAALRLAARFAPDRFDSVYVKVVSTDDIFLHGSNGRSPKFTTHLNGSSCQGRWLVIRETGEVVGREGAKAGIREYGADLLGLLAMLPSVTRKRPVPTAKREIKQEVKQEADPTASQAGVPTSSQAAAPTVVQPSPHDLGMPIERLLQAPSQASTHESADANVAETTSSSADPEAASDCGNEDDAAAGGA